MFCPQCARPIEGTHRFCGGCGLSLAGVTDVDAAADTSVDTPDQDVVTTAGEVLADPDPSSVVESSVGEQRAAPVEVPSAVDAVVPTMPPPEPALPDLGDLPTRPIDIRPQLPEPQWAPTETIAVDDDIVPTTPIGVDESFGSTTGVNVIQADPQPPPPGPLTTGMIPSTDNAPRPITDEMPLIDPGPPLFDGATDVRELPLGREPFTLKLVFLLAFFGAIAAVMTSAATVIDLRTSVPVDGISTGPRLLDDLGTNLAVAGFVGVAVMVIGALLSCFGFRWGGGLAGGAGLAVAGWAAVTIGLAELPISAAEATTRASPIPFTLKVTRDLGFWLLVIAGAIGVLVFIASLRSIRSGGHPPHNPWVAAVGAVAGVVLVAGPLLPVGDAEFSNNFRSTNTQIDLPTLYFTGRLTQLALILLCVVVGLLIVRAYGLGVAAGGVSVAAWMWISSLLEFDTQPPGPMGIAIGNFGAADTSPHAVTTVGMVLTILMLLIGAVLASAGHFRHHRR